jgi:hypothetical protein
LAVHSLHVVLKAKLATSRRKYVNPVGILATSNPSSQVNSENRASGIARFSARGINRQKDDPSSLEPTWQIARSFYLKFLETYELLAINCLRLLYLRERDLGVAPWGVEICPHRGLHVGGDTGIFSVSPPTRKGFKTPCYIVIPNIIC